MICHTRALLILCLLSLLVACGQPSAPEQTNSQPAADAVSTPSPLPSQAAEQAEPPLRLKGHSAPVSSVAFSPDGAMLASAGHDGSVRLWNTADGSPLQMIAAPGGPVLSVAFSPDGATLATGSFSSDGVVYTSTISLWRTGDGTLLRSIDAGYCTGPWPLAFSPDGQQLAAGCGGSYTSLLWRVADGALLHTLKGHTNWVRDIAFAPDGSSISAAGADGTVRRWRVADGELLQTEPEQPGGPPVLALAIARDAMLALGAPDHSITLQPAAQGEATRSLAGHRGAITHLAFSGSGALLASSSEDQTIRVWRMGDGATLYIVEARAQTMALAPDGAALAVPVAQSNEIVLFRLAGEIGAETIAQPIVLSTSEVSTAAGETQPPVVGAELLRIVGHTDHVLSVAFSPDGATLASGGGDQSVRLWRARDGAPLRTLRGHNGPVYSVAFSPDGASLASAGFSGADSDLMLWRVADAALLHTLDVGYCSPWQVSFSPDGQLLAVACGGSYTVELWRVADGVLLHTLKGHTNWVKGVAFSPDGATLASAGDESVRIWQVGDGTQQELIAGPSRSIYTSSVAFGRTGLLAFPLSDHSITLWRMGGAAERSLAGHSAEITSLRFSPDGGALASLSGDNSLRIWQASDGAELLRIDAPLSSGLVVDMAFSPDGATLAVPLADQSIALYRLR